MKWLSTFLICLIVIGFNNCNFRSKRIRGNGNIVTETINISQASDIRVSGSFSVFIDSGAANIKIETDENLINEILVLNESEDLIIKPKKYKNLIPTSDIKIYITTPELNRIKLAGNCDVKSLVKLYSDSEMEFDISGSGNLDLNLHAPKIKVSIAGSGDVFMMGETRTTELKIAGNGDFKGFDLKAENVSVSIAGNGDAQVFSSKNLNVKIAGNGSIKYKGNPNIIQKIMGNGSITHEAN